MYSFHDKAKTLSVLLRLMSLFRIIDTSASDVIMALNSEMTDYENAVMAESAKRCLMDAVVTRDGHFHKADIRVVSPIVLVSELADKTQN